MIVVDTNLLLYAVFDAFDQHEATVEWWEDAIGRGEIIGLTAPAVLGFVRLSTNRRVFETPLDVTDAIEICRGWLSLPNVSFLRPGAGHLDQVLDLIETTGAAANLTTDAQIAALALEHRATVASNDTDFHRFPRLSFVNPLER